MRTEYLLPQHRGVRVLCMSAHVTYVKCSFPGPKPQTYRIRTFQSGAWEPAYLEQVVSVLSI